MSACKTYMLTALIAATAAVAVTAAYMSGSTAQARHLRHSVHRTVKQLNRAMDVFS